MLFFRYGCGIIVTFSHVILKTVKAQQNNFCFTLNGFDSGLVEGETQKLNVLNRRSCLIVKKLICPFMDN